MRFRDVRGTATESLYDLATLVIGTFGFVLAARLFNGHPSDWDWTFALLQGMCLVYIGQYARRKRAESAPPAPAKPPAQP